MTSDIEAKGELIVNGVTYTFNLQLHQGKSVAAANSRIETEVGSKDPPAKMLLRAGEVAEMLGIAKSSTRTRHSYL